MGACVISARTQGADTAGKKVVECTVTLSASYATGGDTVALTSLGMKRVDRISQNSHNQITRKAHPTTATRTGMTLELGGTSQAPKLLAYDTAATEATAASNNSARGPFKVRFHGC